MNKTKPYKTANPRGISRRVTMWHSSFIRVLCTWYGVSYLGGWGGWHFNPLASVDPGLPATESHPAALVANWTGQNIVHFLRIIVHKTKLLYSWNLVQCKQIFGRFDLRKNFTVSCVGICMYKQTYVALLLFTSKHV